MTYIRKIKKKNGTYLAEVESKWINGKVVQKHIRYIGKLYEKPTSKLLKKESNFLMKLEIIKDIELGKSKEDLSKMYNVTIKTISNIKKRFDENGIDGLKHTRKKKHETIKVSTPKQAAIITEVIINPKKTAKEIKDSMSFKVTISEIKKIILPVKKHLKLKKKIYLEIV